MRYLLVAFGVLTALATNQLYVMSSRTDRFFAWTIRPNLSAAFLGAGYAAGCLLVLTTLPAKTWARARLPVVTVLVFTLLTLAATLLSTSPFHFHSGGGIARFAAWFWLAVYIVVPLWMIYLIGAQQRIPLEPRPTTGARPSAPLRVALRIEAVVLAVVGVLLYFWPSLQDSLWPWHLTALTARTSAAWIISFALAAYLASAERDLARMKWPAVAYGLFALLQLAALPRYHAEISWSKAATTGYLVVLAVVIATAAAGWRQAARTPRPGNTHFDAHT
jgi:uncharacterized membrane protein YoaK (UPF0700 family)